MHSISHQTISHYVRLASASGYIISDSITHNDPLHKMNSRSFNVFYIQIYINVSKFHWRHSTNSPSTLPMNCLKRCLCIVMNYSQIVAYCTTNKQNWTKDIKGGYTSRFDAVETPAHPTLLSPCFLYLYLNLTLQSFVIPSNIATSIAETLCAVQPHVHGTSSPRLRHVKAVHLWNIPRSLSNPSAPQKLSKWQICKSENFHGFSTMFNVSTMFLIFPIAEFWSFSCWWNFWTPTFSCIISALEVACEAWDLCDLGSQSVGGFPPFSPEKNFTNPRRIFHSQIKLLNKVHVYTILVFKKSHKIAISKHMSETLNSKQFHFIV